MNDSSGVNPSDPSSMFDNGKLNNGIMNYRAQLPSPGFVKSKLPK